MAQFLWDLVQGSSEWYKIRSRIPTSSEFDKVITPVKMTPSAQDFSYKCRIIAGRLLNWQADSLEKIRHIEDGRLHEPLAVAQLEEMYEIDTTPVGLVLSNDGRVGASPDRVAHIGRDRTSVGITVEVKSPTIPIQIERLALDDDELEAAYRCQRQGHLFVAEADKAIFVSYHPQCPIRRVETGRNEVFIKALKDVLERFNDDLERLTEKVKSRGAFQAFAEIITPAEAELAPEAQLTPLDPAAEVARWLE